MAANDVFSILLPNQTLGIVTPTISIASNDHDENPDML